MRVNWSQVPLINTRAKAFTIPLCDTIGCSQFLEEEWWLKAHDSLTHWLWETSNYRAMCPLSLTLHHQPVHAPFHQCGRWPCSVFLKSYVMFCKKDITLAFIILFLTTCKLHKVRSSFFSQSYFQGLKYSWGTVMLDDCLLEEPWHMWAMVLTYVSFS